MNTNYELLQFYIYKHLVRRKDADNILEECKRLNVSVRDYLRAREMVTEATELEALAEYYCMPSVEIDMLDIDKSLFDLFTYDFMKKHKVIPVSFDKNGVLLVATGKPLSVHTRSALSVQFNCKCDYILVPPVQIDRYVDSISAVVSTASALDDLNNEKSEQQVAAQLNDVVSITHEDDVINNPAVRLVDSIIKEAIPYRASDIHIEPFEKNVRVRYRIDGDLQERAEYASMGNSARSCRSPSIR